MMTRAQARREDSNRNVGVGAAETPPILTLQPFVGGLGLAGAFDRSGLLMLQP